MCRYAYANANFKRSSTEVKLLTDSFIFRENIWVQVPERFEIEFEVSKVCSAWLCTECKYKCTFGVYKLDQMHKLLVQAANNVLSCLKSNYNPNLRYYTI